MFLTQAPTTALTNVLTNHNPNKAQKHSKIFFYSKDNLL